MAHPRKKRGFRSIIIDSVVCRWRFCTENPHSRITLYSQRVRICHSERSEESLGGWACRTTTRDASLPLSMTNVSFLPVESIQGAETGGQQMIVTLLDWRDRWRSISGVEIVGNTFTLHTSARNEPAVVTPRLASEAILWGISYGWKPDAGGATLFVVFRNGTFSVDV